MDELNETFITLEGHVELHKYKYLYFVFMLTAYVCIIICNLTIVYVIWMHRNLHEPMYILIAALLLNSLVFCTNIYPKLLSDFLSEKQIVSYSYCYIQFFLFYSLSGSEFWLLAFMAYDRYVSICKPLQYATVMGRKTVSIFLSLAWLVPASVTGVQVILSSNIKLCKLNLNGILCNNSIYHMFCVSSKVHIVFGALSVAVTALLSMLFIIFSYTRILIIAFQSSQEVRKKAAKTCTPHLLVLMSFSCLCAFDVIIVRLGSNFTKVVRLVMTLQVILYHPLFNPIIYGLKVKEISKQLKRLFHEVLVLKLKN
ncbi:PREDICTED: olfactory receptor 4K3-like [Cyprinodon variegatus]|uniref:olfactory receptor 4K3-like n=1 Tax=Cyprinodon variegatus TaxID=28743 RepID=UPI000742A088|nr:PREDICTED: olfactory receptor 4K3-like [Cyprinodon variegatus]